MVMSYEYVLWACLTVMSYDHAFGHVLLSCLMVMSYGHVLWSYVCLIVVSYGRVLWSCIMVMSYVLMYMSYGVLHKMPSGQQRIFVYNVRSANHV